MTDLCNLRCKYCIPENGVAMKGHQDILSFEEIMKVVAASVDLGIRKIRITGGEPMVRRGIRDLVAMIGSVPGVEDLSMTTNGLMLEETAASLKDAGLHRVNISLDSLDADKYSEITRGGSLQTVLNGIAAAKAAGLNPLKINTVLIGGFNDDEIPAFVRWTQQEAVDVRFIELMPIGEASRWSKANFIPNDTVLKRMPELIPEGDQDENGPARYYRMPGGIGRVGLINPVSSHFCGSCNRLRLTADGRLKPCLHDDLEISLKEGLRGQGDLRALVEAAISQKPVRHGISEEGFKPVVRNMHQIGG